MLKSRVKKLEHYIPGVKSEPDKPDLSPLSVPELEELEGYAIKKEERGESFTAAEVKRINEIMAKTKSS